VTFSPLPPDREGTSPAAGEARTGLVLADRRIVDICAALGADESTRSMLGIIRAGEPMLARLRELERRSPVATLALADVKLHAPIPRPTKNIFCVGWNYLSHFEEGGRKQKDDRVLPEWPVFFTKTPTTVNGPYDAIPYDASVSTALDWEVELGVIVGPGGKDIALDDAMRHVWGYTVVNDVTWRDIQRRHGGQWHKGKSLDGTCPMGPWIVTADSLSCDDLAIACRVNGAVKQESSTRHMYFKVPRLIRDLSIGMTLEPGDIISTGTPEGVGYARTPPEFLKPGDLLETEVQGIGTMRNTIG
jgi:2-keto-4-pentenoate hydratase/2-oxohepta-3-ene-1,7-dioic acid hydratase in catechol pathway